MVYIELNNRQGQAQIYSVGGCWFTSNGMAGPILSTFSPVKTVKGGRPVLEEIVSSEEHRHLTQQMEARNNYIRDTHSYQALPFLSEPEVVRRLTKTPRGYRQVVIQKKKERRIRFKGKILIF